MYEREDPESSVELPSSSEPPSAERSSGSLSLLPVFLLLLLLLTPPLRLLFFALEGLLLLRSLPTERHAPLFLPLFAPVSSISSSPLFSRHGARKYIRRRGRQVKAAVDISSFEGTFGATATLRCLSTYTQLR